MTSPSRKRRPTTPPSTSAASRAEAARAYQAVDSATRRGAPRSDAHKTAEPLWLPAGWLAAVLALTAAAPSFGASPASTASSDGWRARSSSVRTAHYKAPRVSRVRPVAFEDDIAGPSLRTAGRMDHTFYDGDYRVAQQGDAGAAFGDSLRDSFERPFGVGETGRPTNQGGFDTPDDSASGLFDDVPEEPVTPEPDVTPDEYLPQDDDSQMERRAGSAFDEQPEPEPIDPGESTADEMEPGYDSGDTDPLAAERARVHSACEEGLAELKASRLDSIDLYIGVTGDEGEDYPYQCSLDDGSIFAPRAWCEVTYMWKASGLCHKPLYFEDVHLERYGHSWGPYVQPLVSGAHFFGRLPVLPYMMGLKAPNECVYTLGHYRPGNCAPYLIDPIPFTWRAAALQAGATVGAAAVLP